MPTALPALQISLCQHRDDNVIAVRFGYDKALISRFRQLAGARWSQTLNSWYVPDTPEHRNRFLPQLNTAATAPASGAALPTPVPTVPAAIAGAPGTIHTCNAHVLPAVHQLLVLKGYSPQHPAYLKSRGGRVFENPETARR